MTQFLFENPWVGLVLYLWTLPWKGWALWKSAQKKEKIWFIAMLLINTIGILEILYIYVFSDETKAAKLKKIFTGGSKTSLEK
ncbi:MAG: hypothetical protein UT48_C0008G0019 [Parcubacteria group bacterium GW2011_GWE2_39_37]|uniref:DUF5652 domain-containing protein n=1 Tax=Candidatus Falkowbacteria bacterium GW2011_GWF2_39_8 TaxID=1618642 RepID=A0A0G0S9F1_9BACT|nr:MAG: hypothetical protein UT48_C0008G0019 [Parcubacteria group bacterium GW2011_GWE2_39_37]KKR31375.1 MAG: hypothetical protein UT64_C0062G0006 [Candidatus Falkowbacteria bacterium GW2011_GWF2_39_8]